MPGSGIAGSYGLGLCLVIWQIARFFQHGCPILHSNQVNEGSNFPTSLLTLVIIGLLDGSHSNGCEMASHFDFHFPDD